MLEYTHIIYDGKRRRPDRVKKPVVKIPVDLVTDFWLGSRLLLWKIPENIRGIPWFCAFFQNRQDIDIDRQDKDIDRQDIDIDIDRQDIYKT